MIELRAYQPDDLDDLYRISLATAAAGRDASHMYQDPKLMGHIYAAPYAVLAPELAFVAADSEGLAGYVVGVANTEMWQERLEHEWWPGLRRSYQPPDQADRANWTPDQRRISMIFAPEGVPSSVAKSYPAHLHINLLPRLQRRGIGSRLFHHWREQAAAQGVSAMHVGINRANTGAQHFWRAQGFLESVDPPSERTLWMGRHT
jgi:ribosomal protein S18 acetylase RimI-like enzyme